MVKMAVLDIIQTRLDTTVEDRMFMTRLVAPRQSRTASALSDRRKLSLLLLVPPSRAPYRHRRGRLFPHSWRQLDRVSALILS